MQTYYPGIKAIKDSRTSAQAKAIGEVVLTYMREKDCTVAANKFEKSYLSDKWLTWYIGCVGYGFTPTTNPIESWHKTIKGQPGIGLSLIHIRRCPRKERCKIRVVPEY